MNKAIFVALLLVLASAGLSVASVYLLAGMAWAMVCGAAWCLALAAVILRGVSNG